ncbi:MAG TPA: substrate-binding domain-containing protein [Actinoplanes sp.]|nr:substrate-binding domain-containing protein [Actinoplanes sp.]
MRLAMAALATSSLLAAGALTACTNDGGDSGNSGGGNLRRAAAGTGKVGVILPDTKTSQRWAIDDPKFLKAAFDEAGVPVDIRNAEGDKQMFVSIADDMINSGVRVLMIVNLDSVSGKAVLDKAKAAGIKTIDYDRLTLNGGADYYVSFDNVGVGVLQGRYLKKCLKDKGYQNPVVAELNGSPTDNNATEFKSGYDSVLQRMYDQALYTKGPDQSVPDWVNEEGGVIFEQMLEQQPRIRGVLAANDGLANAVIQVLKERNLNGQVPVTGQDATVQGLQNILTGDQCMTVYKAIKPEADEAAALAIKLYKGETPSTTDMVKQKDPESGAYVWFVKLEPKAIDRTNIEDVIKDGFVQKSLLCKGRFADLCAEAGL